MTELNQTAGQLRAFVERVERLEEEKAAISEHVSEVYAEAKGEGYNPKVMRRLIKLRAMAADDRAEQESLLDLYMRALGMATE